MVPPLSTVNKRRACIPVCSVKSSSRPSENSPKRVSGEQAGGEMMVQHLQRNSSLDYMLSAGRSARKRALTDRNDGGAVAGGHELLSVELAMVLKRGVILFQMFIFRKSSLKWARSRWRARVLSRAPSNPAAICLSRTHVGSRGSLAVWSQPHMKRNHTSIAGHRPRLHNGFRGEVTHLTSTQLIYLTNFFNSAR